MRTDVTEVDGQLDVLSAMKIMKKVGATSLVVKRRDENDEYGLLLFSNVAKKVIAKNRAPERVNVYEIMGTSDTAHAFLKTSASVTRLL
jgi:signal-transduction protein with cAMP-binding, CBS, and nucleotidyltransferase domain